MLRRARNQLCTQNKVTAALVPKHEGYKGNDDANALTREGPPMAMKGPETFCGVAKPSTKTSTK